MEYDQLTNDAKYLLTISYKNYLSNIQNGQSKSDSRYLDNISSIKENLLPEFSLDDIFDMVKELQLHGFLTYEHYWEKYPSEIELTTNAISFNEQKFKRNLKSVVSSIATLKQLIF